MTVPWTSSAAVAAAPAEAWPPDWLVGAAAAAAGACWGLAVTVALTRLLPEARPGASGGVGDWLNLARRREAACFLAALLATGGGGWAGLRLARATPRGLLAALILAMAGLGGAAWAARGTPSGAGRLLGSLATSPSAWADLALLGAALLWFTRPWPGHDALAAARSPGAAMPPARPTDPRGVERWAPRIGRFVLILLHVAMAMLVCLPGRSSAAWLALALAVAAAWGLAQLTTPPPPSRRVKPPRDANLSVWLERAGWWVLAPAPWALVLQNWRRSRGDSTLSVLWPAVLGLVAVGWPLGAGWLRRRQHRPAPFKPWRLIPWSVLALLSLSGLIAYSQAGDSVRETSLSAGADALYRLEAFWRAVFHLHDTASVLALGWLAGLPAPPLAFAPPIYPLLTAAAVAWLAWLYLRLWGWAWWPAILALTLIAGAPPAASGGLCLVFWLAMGCVLAFLRTQRLKWLTLAGALAGAACLVGSHTGALAMATLVPWTLAWGLGGWQPAMKPSRAARTIAPLLALGLGILAVGVPWLAGLAARGVTAEFGSLWVASFAAGLRDQTDPFVLTTPAQLLTPALTILALWASLAIVRARDRSPLAGLIVFLTIANAFGYLWVLVNADAVRLALPSMASWPLAGCLAAWRSGIVAPPAAKLPRGLPSGTLHAPALARAIPLAILVLVWRLHAEDRNYSPPLSTLPSPPSSLQSPASSLHPIVSSLKQIAQRKHLYAQRRVDLKAFDQRADPMRAVVERKWNDRVEPALLRQPGRNQAARQQCLGL
jgi:hypothetical protein